MAYSFIVLVSRDYVRKKGPSLDSLIEFLSSLAGRIDFGFQYRMSYYQEFYIRFSKKTVDLMLLYSDVDKLIEDERSIIERTKKIFEEETKQKQSYSPGQKPSEEEKLDIMSEVGAVMATLRWLITHTKDSALEYLDFIDKHDEITAEKVEEILKIEREIITKSRELLREELKKSKFTRKDQIEKIVEKRLYIQKESKYELLVAIKEGDKKRADGVFGKILGFISNMKQSIVNIVKPKPEKKLDIVDFYKRHKAKKLGRNLEQLAKKFEDLQHSVERSISSFLDVRIRIRRAINILRRFGSYADELDSLYLILDELNRYVSLETLSLEYTSTLRQELLELKDIFEKLCPPEQKTLFDDCYNYAKKLSKLFEKTLKDLKDVLSSNYNKLDHLINSVKKELEGIPLRAQYEIDEAVEISKKAREFFRTFGFRPIVMIRQFISTMLNRVKEISTKLYDFITNFLMRRQTLLMSIIEKASNLFFVLGIILSGMPNTESIRNFLWGVRAFLEIKYLIEASTATKEFSELKDVVHQIISSESYSPRLRIIVPEEIARTSLDAGKTNASLDKFLDKFVDKTYASAFFLKQMANTGRPIGVDNLRMFIFSYIVAIIMAKKFKARSIGGKYILVPIHSMFVDSLGITMEAQGYSLELIKSVLGCTDNLCASFMRNFERRIRDLYTKITLKLLEKNQSLIGATDYRALLVFDIDTPEYTSGKIRIRVGNINKDIMLFVKTIKQLLDEAVYDRMISEEKKEKIESLINTIWAL